MKKITVKLLTPDTLTKNVGSYKLRIYPPNLYIDGTYSTIIFQFFKNGSKFIEFKNTNRNNSSVMESVSASRRNSIIDFEINNKEAREILNAIEKKTTNIYNCYMHLVSNGSSGESYKVDLTTTDDFVFPYIEPTSSVYSPIIAESKNQLPSYSPIKQNEISDKSRSSNFSYNLNENNFSGYGSNISISYALLNRSTIRVLLADIPKGYKRLEILSKKQFENNFNSKSIRKLNTVENNNFSNFFFAGDQTDEGNYFNEFGGYIAFDMQIFADERNKISERINNISQNYFRNSKNNSGEITRDPVSNIPIYKVPIVNSGEYANIKVICYGDLGQKKEYNLPIKISTMGYYATDVNFDLQPSRINSIPRNGAKIMTTNPGRDTSAFNISLPQPSGDDVAIDLGFKFKTDNSKQIPNSMKNILKTVGLEDTINFVSNRSGGSYFFAKISRYDSYTGQTFDLGFTEKDKFVDKIFDPDVKNSLTQILFQGSVRNLNPAKRTKIEQVKNILKGGLRLVYNFQMFEITPEMISSYLTLTSSEDLTGAALFSNTTNKALNGQISLFDFIEQIAISRNLLKTASLYLDYFSSENVEPTLTTTVSRKQDNTNIPFNEITVYTNNQYVSAFFDVYRIDTDPATKSKLTSVVESGTNTRIGKDIFTKKVFIGTFPFESEIRNGFLINDSPTIVRDFIPSDRITNMSNGTSTNLETKYEICTYHFVSKNGLLSDQIIKGNTITAPVRI